MKRIIATLFLIVLMMFVTTSYAEINFEVEKTEWHDKAVYDIKDHVIHGPGNDYDWSKDEDISTIDFMPEPNITVLSNGYISKVNEEYYWAGRLGERNSILPIIPLGTTIPGDLNIYTNDYLPDLFPYSYRNQNIKYEVKKFNNEDGEVGGLKTTYGDIAKWVFGWDGSKTYIFADGINAIETNLTFSVYGHPTIPHSDTLDIVFWEDDEKFYIKNYNILISTDKESFYAAMKELEAAPKVKYRDTYLAFEQPPVVQDDRTLIPIRFLFEQMGADVGWNQETQTATVSQNNTAIAFAINETDADINGQTVTMDVPAQLINGKTMVPVRFLSENLGYTVDWDGENRIITIE